MSTSVCVIGLGYIGLPTATAFATRRHSVVGVDINPHTVDIINQGRIHIVEPGLDIAVHAAVNAGYLRATTTPVPADAFIVAVPTPFKEGHKPDLSYIEAASRSIAHVLRKGSLVILESTSPVGSTEQMAQWLAEFRPDLTFPQQAGANSDIRIAHCPERVLPGQVMRELVENDRVIGGMTPRCTEAACALYRIFVSGECITTDVRTAEMCKLTENASRDVSIAFANELSLICDRLKIDVWELIRLANRHPRVKILRPGPGVGGHCIAVDPWFIVDSTPEQARLIRTAREVNDSKPEWVVERFHALVGKALAANPKKSVTDLRVTLLGLAFKPDIDDLRESPAVHIAERISGETPIVLTIVEPHVQHLPACLSRHRLSSMDTALAGSDIVIILVAHKAFTDVASHLSPGQLILDTVGLISEKR